MSNCPDVQYSLENKLHRVLLKERYERRHSGNINVYLSICILKPFVPFRVVVLFNEIPIVQTFAFEYLLAAFQIGR